MGVRVASNMQALYYVAVIISSACSLIAEDVVAERESVGAAQNI